MTKPFFSVIIPLYNKEYSILQTLNSVLKQDFADFEVIVVNDGSTDDSFNVACRFTDSRIRVVDKPNGGVSSARNRGIEESKADYIAFLDGDDLWETNHLSTLKELIENYPEASFYATRYRMSDRSLRTIDESFLVKDFFLGNVKENGQTGYLLVWTSCVVAKRDCFEKVGSFNEEFSHGEDLDLWKRLGWVFLLAKSKRVTAAYNIDAENRAMNRELPENTQKLYRVRPRASSYSEKIEFGQRVFFNSFIEIRQKKSIITNIVLLVKNMDVVAIAFAIYSYSRLFKNER